MGFKSSLSLSVGGALCQHILIVLTIDVRVLITLLVAGAILQIMSQTSEQFASQTLLHVPPLLTGDRWIESPYKTLRFKPLDLVCLDAHASSNLIEGSWVFKGGDMISFLGSDFCRGLYSDCSNNNHDVETLLA